MWLLACLFQALLLCAQCFRSPVVVGGLGVPRPMRLHAKCNQLKGARKYHRRRPKKTTPAKIYPSPTLYYGNIQDYFGAPREYYAVPCGETSQLLRGGVFGRLIGLLKRGTTAASLSQEFESDPAFLAGLSSGLQQLREIASRQRCDVTSDLVTFFSRVIECPADHPNFVDRGHALKRLQEFWRRREFARYRGLLKQVFWRMREIAAKLGYAGVSLQEFHDPALWRRYGVFKGLPHSTMVDNYLEKHKVALSSDIRDLYFIDADTGEVRCALDGGSGGCRRARVESLDSRVIARMSADLKALGVFPNDDWQTLNMSRVDELQRECGSAAAQRAYAIRDFYLTHAYPGYAVSGDPIYLESFVNHRYRTRTLERDIGEKYANWLRSGARRALPRPIGAKYQHLAVWKRLSRTKRRQLVQEFLYPRADSPPAAAESDANSTLAAAPAAAQTHAPG